MSEANNTAKEPPTKTIYEGSIHIKESGTTHKPAIELDIRTDKLTENDHGMVAKALRDYMTMAYALRGDERAAAYIKVKASVE